ncbi:MAG: serine/threonine-protein kinase [Kofleriaceae bacterium]
MGSEDSTESTPPHGSDAADRVMGEAPAADKLVRDVSRAKIEAQLFATREPVKLGRYHLLEVVGSGGMGVVWGAWDPELDRRVAIKLVKADRPASRDRILLEGQALAKLSHPNVVAVHDVGLVEQQVYIVMEWVRGNNLRTYCKDPRRIAELLWLYRAAGEGLSAAHRAGLVHRDFKPDNAVVGDDGRVRVLDFGLARGEVQTSLEDDTPSDPAVTRGAGTPRYMAPEQAAGNELTAAVDQFAFCVALREALRGRNADGKQAEVPRWIEAILDRGTAHQSTKRFPSMDELLRALGRDPAKRWRRRLLVASALGATGAAFAIGSLSSEPALVPCIGGKAEIAGSWSTEVRGRIGSHLQTLGAYGAAEAIRIAPELERYATRWATTHRAACLAHEQLELTPQRYEHSLGCLARSRAAYDGVLDVLASVPAERLPDGIVALHGLPEVERCAEGAATTFSPPAAHVAQKVARLDRELEDARMRALAADPAARDSLSRLAVESDLLQYAPSIARAHLLLGFALQRTGRTVLAFAELERAISAAIEAGDDVTYVEAYARQVYIYGITPAHERPQDLEPPLASRRIAELVARRLQRGGAFVRALLYNNLGVAYLAAADESAARTWFERAYKEWQSTRNDSLELTVIPTNLALVTPIPGEQRRLFDEAVSRVVETLGRHHPVALDYRFRAAMLIPAPVRAAPLVREVCGEYRSLHPHLGMKFNRCSYELALIDEDHGDQDNARVSLAAIAAPAGSQDPEPRVGRVRLLGLQGEYGAALHEAEPLAGELARANEWYVRIFAADTLVVAATSNHHLGHTAKAIDQLREALAILSTLTVAKTQTFYQRRLARTRATLAKLLARRGRPGDRGRAAELARDAITWYRAAGDYASVIAELEAVTDSR